MSDAFAETKGNNGRILRRLVLQVVALRNDHDRGSYKYADECGVRNKIKTREHGLTGREH